MKATKEKSQVTYKAKPIRIITYFSITYFSKKHFKPKETGANYSKF